MMGVMEARVDSRGRVTIPLEIRRRQGITPGTRLIVREEEGRMVVMTRERHVRSLRGKYKGMGLMRALIADRKT
jgi:AbrB family looped-hinge helix DNA binding protein